MCTSRKPGDSVEADQHSVLIGIVKFVVVEAVRKVEIAKYAHSIGQKVPGGFERDLTNEELANAANITPYTTSRIFSEWEKAGAICRRRKRLLLRSPEKLFRRVASSGLRHPGGRNGFSSTIGPVFTGYVP